MDTSKPEWKRDFKRELFEQNYASCYLIWKERYCSIVEQFRRNGTGIVKFYLHTPKAKQQRTRFLERIEELDENRKLSLADVHERKRAP